MWDAISGFFTSAVDTAAGWVDSAIGTVGTSTLEAGSTAEWLAFDNVGFDQIGASGISGLGTVTSAAYEAMGFLSDNLGALDLGGLTDSRGVASSAKEQYLKSRAKQLGSSSAGTFKAGQVGRYPGASDPRVARAWNSAKGSANPALRAAMSSINPNISGSLTMKLSPATITRLRKYGTNRSV